MSEVVERVARALWKLDGAPHEWDQEYDVIKDLARKYARAAIAAMREPTPGMVEAIYNELEDQTYPGCHGTDCATDLWEVGITAALE